MSNLVKLHLEEVANTLSKVDLESVENVVKLLKPMRGGDKTVFTFGNGGSASTASHFSNDLIKMCGIRTICISDMIPTILAFSNDHGHDNMFRLPLMKMIDKRDLIIAFSCSGNSRNVGFALQQFPKHKRVIFTGNGLGRATFNATNIVHAPHEDIRVQEDVHLALCHAIVRQLSDG